MMLFTKTVMFGLEVRDYYEQLQGYLNGQVED